MLFVPVLVFLKTASYHGFSGKLWFRRNPYTPLVLSRKNKPLKNFRKSHFSVSTAGATTRGSPLCATASLRGRMTTSAI